MPTARDAIRVDGVLLLDKPAGLSSNAALTAVKRRFRASSAGHTGALDPMATGLLPICLGEATKIAGLFLDADKSYQARLQLGLATTTGDAEGTVCAHAPVPPLVPTALAAVLADFCGAQQQTPPMYSALKRAGQPLYRLARAGLEVERAARPITIHALSLLALDRDAGTLDFEVRCSKGTYVRVLGEDMARALGTVGHLTALRRTAVACLPTRLYTLPEIDALEPAARDALLLPIAEALPHLPRWTLSAEEVARVRLGQRLRVGAADAEALLLLDPTGLAVGVARVDAGRLQPTRVFQPARDAATTDSIAR
ncbi:MAG: tRNA pseudouridine(55) synthase TruB [Xanthomonadales bacterium]|jgi:tRNA pseudouridine55 synthase|nr:tRNA pseudouridine(55) synthase TruB [Xanthomonadales bacterium]